MNFRGFPQLPTMANKSSCTTSNLFIEYTCLHKNSVENGRLVEFSAAFIQFSMEKETIDNPLKISDEKETYWPSIYLVSFLVMFTGIQFSVYFPTLWPFLNSVDRTAPESFFGYIAAAYSIGQIISSPLFGFWMNKTNSVKQPLAFGTFMMFIANLLFCSVESFKETDRRWVMLISRSCVGIGAGILGVMRAYAATASTVEDRAKAITLVQSSFTIGLSVGPVVPLLFTPLSYPGWRIGWISVDMYTSPALLAALANIIALIVNSFFLKEYYAGVSEDNEKKEESTLAGYDVIAVAICVFTQFALMIVITNLDTADAMFAKVMWGWSNEKTVANLAILYGVTNLISVLLCIAFAGSLGKFLSNGRERIFTILGLLAGVLLHVLSFPFTFLQNSLPLPEIYVNEKNVSEVIGCDRNFYHWCETTKQVDLWIFAVAFALLFPICISGVTISMHTLLSKILGPRQQGTVQGVVVMAGSLAGAIGPLIVAPLFEKEGPIPIWYLEIAVLMAAVFCWILYYSRLIPYGENPKIHGSKRLSEE